MATNRINSNINCARRSEEGDDHLRSRLEAVKQYESGAGTIINEFYAQEDYSRRRLAFIGRHPDYKNERKLSPKVRRDVDEVFNSQPVTLSVQEIRQRELDLEIDPLLPFPTFENTETIDEYASYPTTEWVSGMPTDQVDVLRQTRPFTSPSLPPAIMQGQEARDPTNNAGDELTPGHGRRASTPPIFASRIDSVRNSPRPPVNQSPAHVSDKRIQSGNSTQSNMSDNNLPGGEIDQPQQTANTSPDRATSDTSERAADTGSASNTMADTALINPPTEAQLQNVLELLNRPLPRDNGIGAVAGRAVNVPVKPQGTKRTAPPDADDTGESASEAAAPPTLKKVKLNAAKAPSAAAPAPAARDEARTDATRSDSEATVPTTASSSQRKKPASGSSKAVSASILTSSNANDVAAGLALPDNAKTATVAQKLRRQHLKDARAGRRSSARVTDLKPEFWLKDNIVKKEEVESGPVRCVCGTWADDGTADDDYAGCDRDSCMSWQHIACVGEAYKGVNRPYRCHQCDPYRHRVVLQKLRVGGEVKRPE